MAHLLSCGFFSSDPSKRLVASFPAGQLPCWYIAAILLLVIGFHDRAIGEDWLTWRGPAGDSTSLEEQFPAEWDSKGGAGNSLIWKSRELRGISSPIVQQGRLYTIVRDQPETEVEGEKVVCADAATGEILWEHRFNVYLSDVPDTRVGWSSCAADPETGRIYAQGVAGYFCCLEGKSGEVVWERSLHEEFGLLSTYGGRTNIPVIYEDTVLASAVVIGWGDKPKWGLLAKPAHRFLAFDKATGEIRWIAGTRLIPYDTTYSTPTVALLAGQPALVFGSGDGAFWALQPGTGRPIWKYRFSRRGLNVSPLVSIDGHVYMSHSEENIVGNTMGSLVALDASQISGTKEVDLTDKELWRKYELMAGKSSPLLIEDRLYVIDDRAKLFVFDAKTGKQIQRKPLGTVMRSTPVYVDGKIYACTHGGRAYVLEPTARGVKVLHRMRIRGESSNGSPAVANGRIYIPMSEHLYCIGLPASERTATDSTRTANRLSSLASPETDPTPSHVQIVPYDTLLKPGETQAYRVRLYNSRGQYLRDANSAEMSLSLDGPGALGADAKFQAAATAEHTTALVTCKVGELTGTARIRVVPELPWKFDFDQVDDVPLTWVGGRVRYEVREADRGEGKMMVKRTLIPTRPIEKEVRTENGFETKTIMGTTKLGTRSQMWMGSIDLSGYTIQGDFRLPEGSAAEEDTEEGEGLPETPAPISGGQRLGDIGLINSRYLLTLFGASQQLRIYSWCTHDKRTQATIDFDIDPETWYTLKLSVQEFESGAAAVVKGKAWARGEAEPATWQLELRDPAPNLTGSPGLFGNSKDAEIYIDNIRVWANQE